MRFKEINFITSNTNKLVEVRAILSEIVAVNSQSLDLTEIQGTEEEISKDKCRRAAEIVSATFPRPLVRILTFDVIQGGRASLNGGYMSLLQRFEGATWAIHVDDPTTPC